MVGLILGLPAVLGFGVVARLILWCLLIVVWVGGFRGWCDFLGFLVFCGWHNTVSAACWSGLVVVVVCLLGFGFWVLGFWDLILAFRWAWFFTWGVVAVVVFCGLLIVLLLLTVGLGWCGFLVLCLLVGISTFCRLFGMLRVLVLFGLLLCFAGLVVCG